jgi:hypothetical protein
VLGFHAASYFDEARHTLVPNRQGHAGALAPLPARNPRLDRPPWRPEAGIHRTAR